MSKHPTQDSQSELEEATIAEAYLWDLASDKDDWNQFLKSLREYMEAYVTTRVKEAEGFKVGDEVINTSDWGVGSQKPKTPLKVEKVTLTVSWEGSKTTRQIDSSIAALTTTTNEVHQFFPVDGFTPSYCKCGLLESEHNTTNGKEK